MKLIRHGEFNQESPGLELADGRRIDASSFGEDYDETFFANDGIERLAAWSLTNASSAPELPASARLGSPVARPSKIVCIGLNFRDHAAETGAELPAEPITFFKATTALCGPDDPLIIPRGSERTDWEVELAVIIGKRASYLEEQNATEHFAGYSLMCDYSERSCRKNAAASGTKVRAPTASPP